MFPATYVLSPRDRAFYDTEVKICSDILCVSIISLLCDPGRLRTLKLTATFLRNAEEKGICVSGALVFGSPST